MSGPAQTGDEVLSMSWPAAIDALPSRPMPRGRISYPRTNEHRRAFNQRARRAVLRRRRRDRFVHHVVAHPLLVLWPPVGRWLHDRTEP